jgi:tetratricopeptide (TPR) repeat protein
MKKLSAYLFIATSAIVAHAQTASEGLQALDFEQFEKARGIFTTLTQQEPTNGAHFYYLGQAQWKLYKATEAAAAYQAGIIAEPTNPMNYAGLGEIALADEKTDVAKSQFNKALSFNKTKDGRYKDINALRFVADAMVSEETKLVDDAISYIELALEMDKKNYDVLITAGDVYLEKN